MSGLAANFGDPPANADEEKSPVVKELGWLAFEGVADELENPSDDEEDCSVGPEIVTKDSGDENAERNEDGRDAKRVTEAVDGMLMAGRVLRDPLLVGLVAEHAGMILQRGFSG